MKGKMRRLEFKMRNFKRKSLDCECELREGVGARSEHVVGGGVVGVDLGTLVLGDVAEEVDEGNVVEGSGKPLSEHGLLRGAVSSRHSDQVLVTALV